MALDGNYASDAYADMVASQQEYVNKKAKYVRVELADDCQKADKNEDETYTDFRVARNIFADCSDDKATLETNLKKIQEQKQIAINNAVHKARMEGKSEAEIAKIVRNIEMSYEGKITNLQFNISRTSTSAMLKYNTMHGNETAYGNARMESIFQNGNYISELMSLTSEYLTLGRMQQNMSAMQAMEDVMGRGLDLNG